MKHLERTPGSLRPPDPATILQNLPWLSGLGSEVLQALLPHAEFLQLEQGDWLLPQGAESRGIYVIVSGLVKVCVPSVNGTTFFSTIYILLIILYFKEFL